MFPNSKVIKINALSALKGNWATAVSVIMIWVLFTFLLIVVGALICSFIESAIITTIFITILMLIAFLIGAPLFLGVLKYIWHITDSGKGNIEDVFFYFSSRKMYFRAFNLMLQILSKFVIVGSTLIVPSLVIEYIANGGFQEIFSAIPLWLTNFWIIALFLRALGIMLTVILTAKYYLAPFIFIINDEIEPLKAMHLSQKASKISIWNFIGLIFTLMGWFVASILGVTLFFTVPYLITCYIIHSRFAVYYYNEWVKNAPNLSFQV